VSARRCAHRLISNRDGNPSRCAVEQDERVSLCQVVDLLVERNPALVHERGPAAGNSALHTAVLSSRSNCKNARGIWRGGKDLTLRLVETLLGAGADPNMFAFHNETALHTALYVASSTSKLDAIRRLVRGGADLNLRNRDGHTPLFLATLHGISEEVVRTLLQLGARPDLPARAGETAVTAACLRGNYKAMSLILEALVNRTVGNDGIIPAATLSLKDFKRTLRFARRELVEKRTRPFGSVSCCAYSAVEFLLLRE
jgi:ankyrin repeat protein